MTDVRAPVVAGTFYPGSREDLAHRVDQLLEAAAAFPVQPPVEPVTLRGLIVPHAGYDYSGPVAAIAYGVLSSVPRRPALVAILGPSHFEPLRGLAVAPHDAWRTPLGELQLDAHVRRAFVDAGCISQDRPHHAEHSIEVQLPFLQRCLPEIPILPLAVGSGSPWAGAGILDKALPAAALLVVSTDLSHYHDTHTARRLDTRTAAAIVGLDVEALAADDACGVEALRVALAWTRLHGSRVRQLALRDSADAGGDPGRVVGYGAFAITADASVAAA